MAKSVTVTPSRIPRLPEVRTCIDPLEPGLEVMPSGSVLPYDRLGGHGFERLCFEILVAEGKKPQLFGKVGQRDYAADIVVEGDSELVVYQCKNYASPPSWTSIRDELLRFETQWLGNPELPRPIRYVFACAQPLDGLEKQVKWLSFKSEFEPRTSVYIEMCGQDFFNAHLRSRPDIVAGLFSGAWAEVFCGATGWQLDPWVRICRGQARHPSVSRFLQRHDSSLIYVAEDREQAFRSAVSESRVVLVRGLPGTGKTMTTLELLTRLPGPPKPIYYATLLDGLDVVRLWQSAVRRSSLASVFVLDECHLDFTRAEAFVERLQPELARSDSRIAVVLLARSPVPGSQETDIDSELISNLNDHESVIECTTTKSYFRQVLEYLRPDFIGLDEARFSRLFRATGGDLALLDEALDEIKKPSQIDTLDHAVMFGSIYRRYFGGRRVLPTIKEIAALAQFDLTPPTSLFEGGWARGEKEAAGSLVAELFAPPRYRFVHSSLAELVFHSLVRLEVPEEQERQALFRHTLDALWRHFVSLPPEGSSDANNGMASVAASLSQVLRTQLKLLEPELQANLRISLLADERVLSLVDKSTDDIISIAFFHIAVELLAEANMPTVLARYLFRLDRTIRSVLAPALSRDSLRSIFLGLSTLRRHAPEQLESLQQEFGSERFAASIVGNGTVFELLKVLGAVTPEFAGQLLDQLGGQGAKTVIDNTITSGRSIGTLDLTMLKLGKTDEDLLVRLLRCIGAERYVTLIKTNGTVVELLRASRYVTPEFAGEMLDHLDAKGVQALIDKTIASGRSIGTLNWTMLQLRETDKGLLVRLLRCIGAERYLTLIKTNGTVVELFSGLRYVTPEFAGEMLDHLDAKGVQALIDKTITSGRSIGTLRLAMRDLWEPDETLLVRLEESIGAERFLALIEANGTIVDLCRVLEYATPEFAGELLDHLDEESVNALIDKAVLRENNLETLHFSIAKPAKVPALRERLELAIGVAGWWKLLIASGTLNSVTLWRNHFSERFRIAFTAAAANLNVTDWVRILRAGQFRNVCMFVATELPGYPTKAKELFRQSMTTTAQALAQQSGWFDLHTSSLPDVGLGPEAVILNDAFRQRIKSATTDDLDGLDFLEAVNAVALLWRERQDIREELAQDLWDVLGDAADWPVKRGQWAAIRLILSIAARSTLISAFSVGRLFEASCALLNEPTACDETDTLPLFLLLWNLAALSYERGLKKRMSDVLNPKGTQTFLRLLAERVKAKPDNTEKASLFALAGLLHFFHKEFREKLRSALSPLTRAIPRLEQEVAGWTFVPEFFARRGFSLLESTSEMFSFENCQALLEKADNYTDRGPAVEALRRHVQRYAEQSKGNATRTSEIQNRDLN